MRDEPNTSRFVDNLIVMLAIGYAMWVLYFDFCVKLLLGTDLDRSLREKRTAWSVLDTRMLSALTTAFFHGGVGGVKTASSGDTDQRRQSLNQYMTMTVDELNVEISTVKAAILKKRDELNCLENVKYTLDENLWTAYSVKVQKA